MVERSHKGLVLRDVTVKRDGKTFTQKRWVKPGEDEPEERKPSKKEDFASKLNVGDLVTVGGKILKVKNVSQKSKIVLLEGKLGDESFDFDKLNKKGTLETPEGKFKVGEKINFLGDKYMKVEKVSESEQTVKLSNGLVYTFAAIDAGKAGISGGEHNIGDKVNYKDEEHTITRISQIDNTVELDNMGSIKLNEISKEKPKKELKVKDLRPTKKKSKIKDSKLIKKLPKNKSILLIDVAKSVKEATKIVENGGWVWDKNSNIFPDVSDFDKHPIYIHTNSDGKIYGMSQVKRTDEYGYKDKNGKIGEIEYIEINTPMRGKGYGKQIMKVVVTSLSECETITLESLDENSHKFYEAIGMKPKTDHHTNYEYVGDKKWIKNIIGDIKEIKTKKVNPEKLSKEMNSYLNEIRDEEMQSTVDETTSYTGSTYKEINEHLRFGNYGKNEKYDNSIDKISDFLKEAPKTNGTVYRGMSFDDNDPTNNFDEFLNGCVEGKSYNFKSFISTTTNKNVATKIFGGISDKSITFEIKSKSGVYLNGVSMMPTEHEVLFDKNAKFNVIKVDKIDFNNAKIILEEI